MLRPESHCRGNDVTFIRRWLEFRDVRIGGKLNGTNAWAQFGRLVQVHFRCVCYSHISYTHENIFFGEYLVECQCWNLPIRSSWCADFGKPHRNEYIRRKNRASTICVFMFCSNHKRLLHLVFFIFSPRLWRRWSEYLLKCLKLLNYLAVVFSYSLFGSVILLNGEPRAAKRAWNACWSNTATSIIIKTNLFVAIVYVRCLSARRKMGGRPV